MTTKPDAPHYLGWDHVRMYSAPTCFVCGTALQHWTTLSGPGVGDTVPLNSVDDCRTTCPHCGVLIHYRRNNTSTFLPQQWTLASEDTP